MMTSTPYSNSIIFPPLYATVELFCLILAVLHFTLL